MAVVPLFLTLVFLGLSMPVVLLTIRLVPPVIRETTLGALALLLSERTHRPSDSGAQNARAATALSNSRPRRHHEHLGNRMGTISSRQSTSSAREPVCLKCA